MTVKDWLQLAVAAVALFGVAANVRVSMALRERDREDFERLRDEHEETSKDVGKLKERLARIEGRAE